MATALRPLNTGELLDRTFQLYRAHFLLFVGIVALPYLVLLAFQLSGVAFRLGSTSSALVAISVFWTFATLIVNLGVYAASQGATVIAVTLGVRLYPIHVLLPLLNDLRAARGEEDPDDAGGYFIINGSERVLTSIEDLVPNKLMVTKERNGIVSKIFSTHYGFRARCVVERNHDGMFSAEFPSTPAGIPLLQLLRVLGMEKNDDVLSAFSPEKQIRNDVILNIENEQSTTKDEAIDMLSRRLSPGQPPEFRLNRMENLLDNYLLPHIGVTKAARIDKARYLVRMAERATRVAYHEIAPDDKDHYANKRVKLAGDMMEELFRYAFQFLIKDLVYQASRADARGRRLQVHTLIRQDVMGDRIKYAMATGNWIAGQTGVSQLLDRVSYLSTISHLRRVISPLSKKHPHFKARDLHGTHIGKLCPNETPEGPSCSLVKNLSVMAEVSIGVEEEEIERILKAYDVKE